MAKSTLQAIAAVIADRYELKSSDATAFVAAFFDQIREGLAQDKQVKVRGLGTFKLQPVKARESVNVNTGGTPRHQRSRQDGIHARQCDERTRQPSFCRF